MGAIRIVWAATIVWPSQPERIPMLKSSRLIALPLAALAAATMLFGGNSAQAETKTVRLAKQFGISYLPLTIMETKHLLEQHGKDLGLDIKTEWVKFTSGTPMNEALISGNLDFA